ncbi:hypothetical protein YKV153 [Yokapox virus]|uniref:Uncharacterized protein n=1 Tax=Yokapox virus TaxID=1076255 RepID=G3EI45_9POXV|nr:hypothetical protein YKV153 [Yokapox virus]AEN03742.1 unknown protein [Yokapox virus]
MDNIDDGYMSDECTNTDEKITNTLIDAIKKSVIMFNNIDNKKLNINITNFIMGKSDLNDPFIAYLNIMYIISYSKLFNNEMINSYNKKDIIKYIIHIYKNFYTNDVSSILSTIIILKYIMSINEFKLIYKTVVVKNLMKIDIKKIIYNELEKFIYISNI